ncbi:hypothetical protein [Halomonas sp. E14]|uniref:hypothetical protein n=1 Tax=Halomonas sp. E14 TaxID=3397245 RepID=UPI00403E596E
MGTDQAAGLREWVSSSAPAGECPMHIAEALLQLATEGGGAPAKARPAPSTPATAPMRVAPPSAGAVRTLMVLGLPGASVGQTERVTQLLEAWAKEGRRWVGDPASWRIVALPVTSPHLPVLAMEQPHWALWVEDDLDAFRRAFRQLRQVVEQGGPQRLLAVHPPHVGRKGLLMNLRHVAASYLDVDLLVLAR